MKKSNRQFIAYGLISEEATPAGHHLIIFNIKCATENITITPTETDRFIVSTATLPGEPVYNLKTTEPCTII